jgi:hypothetical protein
VDGTAGAVNLADITIPDPSAADWPKVLIIVGVAAAAYAIGRLIFRRRK